MVAGNRVREGVVQGNYLSHRCRYRMFREPSTTLQLSSMMKLAVRERAVAPKSTSGRKRFGIHHHATQQEPFANELGVCTTHICLSLQKPIQGLRGRGTLKRLCQNTTEYSPRRRENVQPQYQPTAKTAQTFHVHITERREHHPTFGSSMTAAPVRKSASTFAMRAWTCDV